MDNRQIKIAKTEWKHNSRSKLFEKSKLISIVNPIITNISLEWIDLDGAPYISNEELHHI